MRLSSWLFGLGRYFFLPATKARFHGKKTPVQTAAVINELLESRQLLSAGSVASPAVSSSC